MAKKSLKNSLKKFIHKEAGEWTVKLPATLGNKSGVVNAGAGFVYARLTNGQVVRVLNIIAPWIFDLQVIIGKSRYLPSYWQVISVRQTYAVSASGGALAYHADQHRFPAGDTVWVERKQLLSLSVLVSDAAGFIVKIFGAAVRTGTGIALIDNQTMDLSAHVPAAGALFVAIESDDDGVLSLHDGDVFDAKALADVVFIPLPTAGHYMIAYILLFESMTELTNDLIGLPWTLETNYSLDTSNFDSLLSPTDDTIQKAFDTLDDHTHAGYLVDAPADGQTYGRKDATWSIVDSGGGVGHEHGMARWVSGGGATFDFPDYVEDLEEVRINGLTEDPLVYSLSSDGSQLVFDDAVIAGFIVTSSYILAQI